MAARHKARHVSPSFIKKDLSSWNFVIFLTLALILLATILSISSNLTLDLRSRAGLACPNPLAAFNGKLPSASDCRGEWKLSQDARGCQVFLCQAKK